ncbi:MFS6L protein, partial [Eudromia elegans]|nr:MFS6L protein [Eudromia elegans]
MGPSRQWDVRGALVASSLFRFIHGLAGGCAGPFLSLYLRHLGLPATLVGAAVAARHLLAATWAPPGAACARSHRRAKALVAVALLGSAAAALLLTLVPPAVPGDTWGPCGGAARANITNTVNGIGANATNAVSANRTAAGVSSTAPVEPWKAMARVLPVGRVPTRMAPVLREAFNSTAALWTSDAGAGDMGTDRHAAGGVSPETPALRMSYGATLVGPREETGGTAGTGVDLDDNPGKRHPFSQNDKLPVFKPPLPMAGGARAPAQPSRGWRAALDAEGQRRVFLMALGAVLLWELLAAPVERAVDDGVYEYLDFVDAADRYGTLWVWGYVGVSVGACGITVLVDRLGCRLGGRLSRLAVHFYAYAVLAVLSLLASAFLPTHAPRKAKRVSRAAKALALLGGDGRAVLAAVTALLAGAAASTTHNFLFWHMEDQDSGESAMGLWVAVGLVAELLLYPLRGDLLRTLPGGGAVALGLGCLAAQLLCYSFAWAAWAALLAQLLSAFSNGALWWALDSTLDDVATPGTERALRALLRGVAQGAGAALGSLAGGLVVDSFGLAALYRACSTGLLLWLCLFLALQSRLPRQKKINYSHLLAADSSDASDSEEEKERDWLVKAMKDESFG